jgi:hypothetical protein
MGDFEVRDADIVRCLEGAFGEEGIDVGKPGYLP